MVLEIHHLYNYISHGNHINTFLLNLSIGLLARNQNINHYYIRKGSNFLEH